jgi:tetratricopeptide (TPR) repeat protein
MRTMTLALIAAAAIIPAPGPVAGQESGAARPGVPHRPQLPTAEDVAALREKAEKSEGARDQYNLGAVLLLAGDWTDAVEPLQRSVEGGDDDLRDDARYNLGVLDAVAARPDAAGWRLGVPSDPADDATALDLSDEEARERLLRAREYLRSVLRSAPDAADARWNLELIERWLREDEPPAGGGGGGGGGQGGGGGGGGGAPDDMTEAEAEAILAAAARTERDVQSRRMERGRQRDPSAERNW